VNGSEASDGVSFDEVGVAVVAIEAPGRDEFRKGAIPGYEDSWGRADPSHGTTRRTVLVEKGDQAVRSATEAIARQIALAAERIARTIEQQAWPQAGADDLTLDSVQVGFGVTLTAGVQTIFTATAESSAQVTITLSRARAGGETR
jgi:hypothetical protein